MAGPEPTILPRIAIGETPGPGRASCGVAETPAPRHPLDRSARVTTRAERSGLSFGRSNCAA
jgi:hypothetical protein